VKGIVFTEFLEMVEQRYSPDLVDDIIEDSDLSSDGVFTSVGTYPSADMTALVNALSERASTPVPDLLRAYGEHLFGRFHALYPDFVDGQDDALSFLATIEQVIHAEVRKLYPDAELPRFGVVWTDPDEVVMEYQSPRCLADLAEGLIVGSIQHFGETATCRREDLAADKSAVRFTVTRASGVTPA
jgi:hypothetical protein